MILLTVSGTKVEAVGIVAKVYMFFWYSKKDFTKFMFLFGFPVFILEVGKLFFKNFNRVTKTKKINSLIFRCFWTFVVSSSDAEGYTSFVDVYEVLKLNFSNFHTISPWYNYLLVMTNFLILQ